MKKVLYGICMLGLVAMISTSCTKKEEEGTTFTVSTTPYVDEDMKAYYHPSNNYFMFEANDQIKVYNIDDNTPGNSKAKVFKVVATGQGEQTIQGPAVGEMLTAYYAFYPATMAQKNILSNENRDEFELPNTQQAFQMSTNSYTMGGDAIPMCAKSTEGLHFQFYNIFGICNIRLYGADTLTVTSVELTDNLFNLGGTVQFKVNKVNQQTIEDLMALFTESNSAFETEYAAYLQELGYHATGKGTTMTYDCSNIGNGGVQLTEGNPANFRIGLRPMALSEGFTYKVFFDGGYSCTVNKYVNPNRAYGMVPNRIKNFTLNISDPTQVTNGNVVWE